MVFMLLNPAQRLTPSLSIKRFCSPKLVPKFGRSSFSLLAISLCTPSLDYRRISFLSINISVGVLTFPVLAAVLQLPKVSLAQEHNWKNLCAMMVLANCFLPEKVADVGTGEVVTAVG